MYPYSSSQPHLRHCFLQGGPGTPVLDCPSRSARCLCPKLCLRLRYSHEPPVHDLEHEPGKKFHLGSGSGLWHMVVGQLSCLWLEDSSVQPRPPGVMYYLECWPCFLFSSKRVRDNHCRVHCSVSSARTPDFSLYLFVACYRLCVGKCFSFN